MGLIYVNPEGPNGKPDPLAAARDIRETFARMAMNDEETVALIAGGHTFGKTHGAANPTHVGPEPEAAPLQQMGLGWHNTYQTGTGPDTITSGLEGAWTPTPTHWDTSFFDTLFGYDWQLSRSPAGAQQWIPTDPTATTVPDAHHPSTRHTPVMLTTDLALRQDPIYEPIARRFHQHPDQLADAFARAWFKLTHRDMGPRPRYLGPLVPTEPLIWQDPIPTPTGQPLTPEHITELKTSILNTGLSISELVTTAWAAATTHRNTDHRGGANGARIRLAPQNQWDVNDPTQLARVLHTLQNLHTQFSTTHPDTALSLADLIVLAGTTAVEQAATNAGHPTTVAFTPGRTDATAEQTDEESFAVLEPTADGFRNYLGKGHTRPTEQLLVDRAQLLSLTAPEMTVLLGGLRVLNANTQQTRHGVLTDRPETLTNDFFVNLLDPATTWTPIGDDQETFEGRDTHTGHLKWTATRADLIFAANSQLRALTEVYASDDAHQKLTHDFATAWTKVMNLDRYDIA